MAEDDEMAHQPVDVDDASTTGHMSAVDQGSEGATSGKRRRWTMEQKRQIVGEGLEPGVSVAMVARKHGISSGQYYAWLRIALHETAPR